VRSDSTAITSDMRKNLHPGEESFDSARWSLDFLRPKNALTPASMFVVRNKTPQSNRHYSISLNTLLLSEVVIPLILAMRTSTSITVPASDQRFFKIFQNNFQRRLAMTVAWLCFSGCLSFAFPCIIFSDGLRPGLGIPTARDAKGEVRPV
jgi:hypothetical protein